MEAFISITSVYSSVMPSAFKGLGLPLIVLRTFVSKPLLMDFSPLPKEEFCFFTGLSSKAEVTVPSSLRDLQSLSFNFKSQKAEKGGREGAGDEASACLSNAVARRRLNDLEIYKLCFQGCFIQLRGCS